MKLNVNNLSYKEIEKYPFREDIRAWFKPMPSYISKGILTNYSQWEYGSDYIDSIGFNKKLRNFNYNGKTKKKRFTRDTIRTYQVDVESTIYDEDELD